MSARLGSALAGTSGAHERVRKRQRIHLGRRGSRVVAEGMAGRGTTLPAAARHRVSAEPYRFGQYALPATCPAPTCATEPTRHGVVLVMCDGEQVPDRQSLNLFESVSPSALLDTPEGMGILLPAGARR